MDMPSSPPLTWCFDFGAVTAAELVVAIGFELPVKLTVESCEGCSVMPLDEFSSVVAVPGWTLLAAAVLVPELTRPWGLWVLLCVPLPEVIDRAAIAFYCKASFSKLIHKGSFHATSLGNKKELPFAGFETHIADIHLQI
jgi:hypothetical protein